MDISGHRYGRTTAQWPVGRVGKYRYIKWLCVCDCGTLHISPQGNLQEGSVNSCGCLRRELAIQKQPKPKHNRCATTEYQSWRDMRMRCNNPRNKHYKYYGGRGITICERWNDFTNFLTDMGLRPSGIVKVNVLYTIDRINNDGNYEPSNCRWATRLEQMNNKRQRQPASKEAQDILA